MQHFFSGPIMHQLGFLSSVTSNNTSFACLVSVHLSQNRTIQNKGTRKNWFAQLWFKLS
jgi:hypothetical protein